MKRRVEASVVLVLDDLDRALVLRRRPDDRSFAHAWCLPGGRIEPGETPAQSAIREVLEETGLWVTLAAELGPRDIDLPTRPIGFRIHRFTGRCAEAPVVLSPEHVDSRWLTRTDAANASALLPGGLAGGVTDELLRRFAAREFTSRKASQRPPAL